MDSLYSQSPRGLAYNVVLAKWSELCSSLIPKLIGIGIQFSARETAIGCKSYTYGDGATAYLGWATSHGQTENELNILISYKSEAGEIFSSHTVPIIDYGNGNGIEIDPERKYYFADKNDAATPTIETVFGLKGFLEIFVSALDISAEDIGINTVTVVGVEGST